MGESPLPTEDIVPHARRYRVAGMSGNDCAERVERALRAVPGVDNATVDVARSEVLIRFGANVADAILADAVEAAGYTLLTSNTEQDDDEPFSVPPDPVPPAPEPPAPEPAPEPPADEPVEQSEPEPGAARSWRDYLTPAEIWHTATSAVMAGLILSLVLALLFRFLPPPFTLLMLGESIFDGTPIYQTWVPLERISPNLVRAVIASEDNEFCHHWGFDFKELQDAWDEAQDGGRLRGASTISQQTAKNVFLWPHRDWIRKGAETYFTVLIETIWGKRRIMEVYLNVAEMGPGVYGAQAAAERYFRTDAAHVSQSQAARLVAILPNPNKYKVVAPGPYIARRSASVGARAGVVKRGGYADCVLDD